MNHNFNVSVAIKYGINEAIIFNHICYWYNYNKANNQNFIDGEYWTYNSYKAFTEIFPYWTERQIKYTIDNLIENKLIKRGIYNKQNYDKTSWYTLDINGLAILQNCQMDVTKLSDGCDKIVRPIPNINHIENQTKESKKERKQENTEISFNSVIDTYIQDPELNKALKEWVKGRLYRKDKITNYAVELACKKVLKMPIEKQLASVEESIINGWKGIFEITDKALKDKAREIYIKQYEEKEKGFMGKLEKISKEADEMMEFMKGDKNDNSTSGQIICNSNRILPNNDN